MSEGGEAIRQLHPDIASWPALSLARVDGTVIGAADFALFNGRDKDRYTIRGVEDFVKIPKEQHRPMQMEDQVDAITGTGTHRRNRFFCRAKHARTIRICRNASHESGSLDTEGEAEAVRRACAVHKM